MQSPDYYREWEKVYIIVRHELMQKTKEAAQKTGIVYFKLLFVKIGFVVAKLQLRSEKRLKKKWKLTYFIRKSEILRNIVFRT